MANEEHLKRLKRDGFEWQEWRRENPDIIPDLSDADLSNEHLHGVNLSKANLSNARLKRADLTQASLNEADLRQADLGKANLCGAHLCKAKLQGSTLHKADLRGTWLNEAQLTTTDLRETKFIGADISKAHLAAAKLSNAKLNLTNLREADLVRVDLTDADLRGADLRGADLRGADLVRTQAFSTDFTKAKLTGACLEDWSINTETNLDDVICDYVYLKKDKKERRPSSGNFDPGDFTTLFRKILHTVDLVFRDGIDWQAFLASFQALRVECRQGELPVIQTIENKNDGAFVIRVSVPPEKDKAEVERDLKRKYEYQLKAIEEKYRLQLDVKDKQLTFYHEEFLVKRQENTRLIGIVETMAEKESSKYQINKLQVTGGWSDDNKGISIQKGGNIINQAPEQRQTLAEAAEEIQKLLKQLEESNPTATVEQQQAFVDAAVSPTLKARFVSALQAGWKEVVKEFLGNRSHPPI